MAAPSRPGAECAIGRGLRKLDGAEPLAPGWVRRTGGRRKTVAASNPGQEWRSQGTPEKARVRDILIDELGRAAPYGVDDLTANAGWVGVDGDTAAFAVPNIRC